MICEICNNSGHMALKCNNRFNHSFQDKDIPQALVAISLEDFQDLEWFPDLGATTHLTNDVGNFSNVRPHKGSDTIIIGNGASLKITHIGNARISTASRKFHLKNVLVVPEITRNLISIGQLVTALSCIINLSSIAFVIKDK